MNTQKLKEMLEEIIETLEDIASDLPSEPVSEERQPNRFKPGDGAIRLQKVTIREKAGPDGWMIQTKGFPGLLYVSNEDLRSTSVVSF